MKLQTLGIAFAVATMTSLCGAESDKKAGAQSVHQFKARTHTDEELDFKTLAGRGLLIVNVASM